MVKCYITMAFTGKPDETPASSEAKHSAIKNENHFFK